MIVCCLFAVLAAHCSLCSAALLCLPRSRKRKHCNELLPHCCADAICADAVYAILRRNSKRPQDAAVGSVGIRRKSVVCTSEEKSLATSMFCAKLESRRGESSNFFLLIVRTLICRTEPLQLAAKPRLASGSKYMLLCSLRRGFYRTILNTASDLVPVIRAAVRQISHECVLMGLNQASRRSL